MSGLEAGNTDGRVISGLEVRPNAGTDNSRFVIVAGNSGGKRKETQDLRVSWYNPLSWSTSRS